HGVGDYLLQSHWMATGKTSRFLPAALHAATYIIPFALITQSPLALLVIAVTHFLIDRYRLARLVVWLKNFVGSPAILTGDGSMQLTGTGYPADVPPWLAVWLLIIADNLIHILINAAAITYL
ncbi:MAG TPA: DUF3307 domain-containing protein, partial [Chloroflexota bacterium]|nr:DUF3307 domain-containing protein [Chloroflexota bacterium]